MKKTLFLILILISVIILIIRIFTEPTFQLFGVKEKSGIKISSNPAGAQVFLDGLLVGQTPYENKELQVKEYSIKLQSDKGLWEGKVKLNPGAETVIGRDLSDSLLSSAGETLTLEKGRGVTILSYPYGADVEIDGIRFGKTPVGGDLEEGEHIFTVSAAGFLTRSVRATSQSGYNLIVNIALAATEKKTEEKSVAIKVVAKVVVLQTPTGFLRIRKLPSVSSTEIARVSPGEELHLLEELAGWYKIKLPDGQEGFLASSFAKKL